jgi:hypothetical protein
MHIVVNLLFTVDHRNMNIQSSDSIKRAKSAAAQRSLVIYHFFEHDAIYAKNLAHFLLFGYRRDVDFLIVIAGETSLSLPDQPNIFYLRTKNQNNDFGGYCEAIRHLGNRALQYDFIYFVNSSVRGPFLSAFASANWLEAFRGKLTPDVGLVGTTINILPHESPISQGYQRKYGGAGPFSHVQTMAYAMPGATLRFLLEQQFYSANTALEKLEVIRDYELRLSQLVLSQGLNISCFLPEYNGIDFRKLHKNINPIAASGDPSFSHTYFGRTAHPLETLFVKTNRGLFTEPYLDRLAFSQLCHADSSMLWQDSALVLDYVAQLGAASRSMDLVQIADFHPSIEHVMNWLEGMLVQYPAMRSQVAQLLERYPVI